jgi:hypothetical protein
MADYFCSGMGGYVVDGRLFLQWYGRLCSEMAVYFCSGTGGYVVRLPAIFAVVWAAM